MERGSEKLTGTGIRERSLPIEFFMMLHKLNEMFGLSGIRVRRILELLDDSKVLDP